MAAMTLVIGVAALGISACGGGLSASSTCKDFSEASAEEQREVISSLSSKFGTPAYTTPLGEPEVSYYCAANSEVTLEEFFQHAAESGEAG
ncbi:MAG: hypothetical protein ACTHKT_12700 [Solirubrobacterales bacterium]